MGIPTNVVDAASQIKDGTLGTIEQVMIGDVLVSALQGLQAPKDKDITTHPVQTGFDITKAAIKKPQTLVMDIVLANPDFSVEAGVTAALTGTLSSFTETWRDKKDKLEQLWSDNAIVTVTTHENSYPGMMVKMIDPWFDVEENWECYIAQVTLFEVGQGQTEAIDSLADAMTAGLSNVGGL